MRALAVTTFLSFSLAIFAAPVSDTKTSLQDFTSASAKYRRDAIPVTLNEPIAVPVGGLVERARGSRAGGEESAADPRKFKSTGGSRREAEPKAEVEAREVLDTRGRFGAKDQRGAAAQPGRSGTGTGLGQRRAVAETIKRSFNFFKGGPDTDGIAISHDAMAERGSHVSGESKRLAEPTDDLIERDPGLVRHPGGSPKRDLTPGRGGSYRREAEPIRISGSRGGHRREAKAVERSMKNPGGGIRGDSESVKLGSPSGHRREAEPAKWDGTSRREAVPEAKNGLNVAAGGGCPRDASPIKIGCRREAAPQPGRLDNGKGHDARPSGGIRISRGLRGNGANPRGVRPGNGNNERDVTAETVEARTRLRGNSHRV